MLFLFQLAALSAVDWQFRQYGDLRVRSAPKDSAYAGLVVRSLQSRISSFQMKLGVYPVTPLEIRILPNRNAYKNFTAGKGRIVENSEAFYSPAERIIYVRSPEQVSTLVYSDVLMHEYIHWFLDETLDNVPLWFHEGMAMYYSGQFGFSTYYNFTRLRFLGFRLSLNDMLNDYPQDKNYWDMFYLTSVFAVQHLDAHRHDDWLAFWNLVGYNYSRPSQGKTLKSDFIRVFNISFRQSLYAFSREFDAVQKRYDWQFPFVGVNALILSLLPLVLILAWLRSRRRLQNLPDVIQEPDETGAEPADEAAPSSDDTRT
jgi:hypothetical protein